MNNHSFNLEFTFTYANRNYMITRERNFRSLKVMKSGPILWEFDFLSKNPYFVSKLSEEKEKVEEKAKWDQRNIFSGD